jgi:hypothetical protein
MTAPVQQQPVQQPAQQPVQQPPGPSDDDLAAAAAAALAAEVTVPAVTAVLAKLYFQAGIERPALQAALQIVMSMPPEATGIAGPATAQVAYLNQVRRGQMVVSIGRRITGDLRSAVSAGKNPLRALLDGVERERRYFGMHRDAIWSRAKAAMAVDMAVLDHGLLLGWQTYRDDHTTPDCLAADGKNFRADSMPLIGFPGTVHAKCRCKPVGPFPGAPMLPSAGITPARTARLQRRMQSRMAA